MSSKCFGASSCTLKSVTHFKRILIVDATSHLFCFLPMDVQLFQHHLLQDPLYLLIVLHIFL